ncbi:MAG TPA: hypothetical protein VFC44_01685 [Candidatus Saccharimonadales bacterium]|nr:hypothetical protein [Candidatus Saccharimonadales bacterium]
MHSNPGRVWATAHPDAASDMAAKLHGATNANLENTNWICYTNRIGNGSLYQIAVPSTDPSQLFFRVTEP